MKSSSTADSNVTETFSTSESDDELDADPIFGFADESDSGSEEQDTEGSFKERRWRVEWLEPKTFTFDSSESGINSYSLGKFLGFFPSQVFFHFKINQLYLLNEV
jgi:hypothetical protein